MRIPVRVALVLTSMLTMNAIAETFDFSKADAAIERAIAAKECPGAVLVVGKGDEIVYSRAYGNKQVAPTTQPASVDTIYDYASLSKSVGCATSILILADRGKIDLDAPITTYLPEFANHGKEKITVRMCLLHHGGFVPDNPMSDYDGSAAEAIAKIADSTPKWEPGTHFAYSDVSFIVLGQIVERVSGKRLNEFAHDEIFVPLKMTETSYLPPADWKPRIAPTEKRKGEWIIGEVHDPRSFALGGVAGHAGVFGTATDLSHWLRMLNAGGTFDGKRILSEKIVAEMLTKDPLPDGSGARGLGVDIDSSYAGCRGDRFDKDTTFGHTGWTGTMFWSDPVNDAYVILFSNRVHPDGSGDMKRVRKEVSTAVAEALLGPAMNSTTQPSEPASKP